MASFKYARGVWVKDKITGYAGCIVSRMDSITGCNRYCIQPEVDNEGKWRDGLWLDEHTLEVDTTKQQINLYEEARQPPG